MAASVPKPEENMTTSETDSCNDCNLTKQINDEKDVTYFKTKSPAYKNILAYVDLLCERIHGTGNKIMNSKYTIKNEVFLKCSEFLEQLEQLCDETDLTQAKGAPTLRFGHLAFRDWIDAMKVKSRVFIDETLAQNLDKCYREELYTYLIESFGNRMRIDYGTGHELSFIIFTMGLIDLLEDQAPRGDDDTKISALSYERLKGYVEHHGWDIIALFAHRYLRLCRKVQIKFRLEPAGSRGVYNMDDFQFIPFLLGAAQLSGTKYISTSDFYLHETVDMFKNDFIFLDAVDFIMNNKRGPFNEHSYTLWCFTNLGSWENIFRRIKIKFSEDVLSPLPIIQHFLFGKYILRWNDK